MSPMVFSMCQNPEEVLRPVKEWTHQQELQQTGKKQKIPSPEGVVQI